MIVSLVSSILGGVLGLAPDIFKEVKESREHGRELERMDKQGELQLKMIEKQTDGKLAEVEANVAVEEMRAFGKQMAAIYAAQKPTGIPFVDGFNAMLRPTTAAMVMLLFIVTAGMYVWAVLSQVGIGKIGMADAATVIWGSLVGDAIQSVLGFLFGYRSTKGRIGSK